MISISTRNGITDSFGLEEVLRTMPRYMQQGQPNSRGQRALRADGINYRLEYGMCEKCARYIQPTSRP